MIYNNHNISMTIIYNDYRLKNDVLYGIIKSLALPPHYTTHWQSTAQAQKHGTGGTKNGGAMEGRGEALVSAEALVNSRFLMGYYKGLYIYILSGWWFGTFGLFFPFSWEVHHPKCYSLHDFSRSRWLVYHQPVHIYIYNYYMILPG